MIEQRTFGRSITSRRPAGDALALPNRPDLRVLPFFAITRYGVKRVTEVARTLLICGGRVLPGTSSQAP